MALVGALALVLLGLGSHIGHELALEHRLRREIHVIVQHRSAVRANFTDLLPARSNPGELTAAIRKALASGARDDARIARLTPAADRAEAATSSAAGAMAFAILFTLAGSAWIVGRSLQARRRAHAAVLESEARYRLVTEHTTDVIVQCDAAGRLTFVGASSLAVLGYTPEEMTGRPIFAFAHADDLAGLLAQHDDNVAVGAVVSSITVQARMLRKDGRAVWIEGRPKLMRDAQGRVVASYDVLRDITARRLAEEAARLAAEQAERARAVADHSEQRYRLLAENATDMIAHYALDGRIKFISPASARLMGYTPEELIGRRNLDFVHPDDVAPLERLHRAQLAAGPGAAPVETRFRAIRKDGRAIWLEGRPTLVLAASETGDGKTLEVFDVVRDVTLRKALEDGLDAARIAAEAAAQVKSDFLANMSHELRTPLTAIIGFGGLMAQDPDLAPRTRHQLERVRSASRSLLATVNDVLDFSQLEAGQVEIRLAPTHPGDLLAEVTDLFGAQAAAKAIALDLVGVSALPAKLALDADRLRQVLTNLVGNAVKFTSEGGVGVHAAHVEGALEVEVVDSGPGIPADRRSALFQRFSQVDGSSTRRHGGAGLGLAISKGLVEAMGGEIGVRSREGAGSTFFVKIPAPIVASEADVAREAPHAAASLDGVRILVVDDNPINLELVGVILRPHGAEVSTSEDGEAALAATRTQAFDVILLDRRMPGVDGEAVARRIRREGGPNGEALLLAFSADVLADASDDFDGAVAKAGTPVDLVETVARHLEHRRHDRRAAVRSPPELDAAFG